VLGLASAKNVGAFAPYGACSAALAQYAHRAAEHEADRMQFGRPTATYKAVKHHCANKAVATELAKRVPISLGDETALVRRVEVTEASEGRDYTATVRAPSFLARSKAFMSGSSLVTI